MIQKKNLVNISIIIVMVLSSFTFMAPDTAEVSPGKTLYAGGSGPGNYTTIQDAIDNADEGDTVFVYHGIYTENVIINKEAITLFGENKKTTIINGYGPSKDQRCTLHLKNNYIVVKNFTIGQNDYLAKGTIHVDDCDYCKILDNKFLASNYGIRIKDSCHTLISGNEWNDDDIRDGYAIEIAPDSKKETPDSCYNVVENNTFINVGMCINLAGVNGGYNRFNIIQNNYFTEAEIGVNFNWKGVNNNTVTNNLFINVYCAISVDGYGEGNIIVGNIFYQNQRGIGINDGAKDILVFHNNFIDNAKSAVDGSACNIWDNVTLCEGNHWSDFDEPGEGAWDNNSDGIVDNPYSYGGIYDEFPLVSPWNITIPPPAYHPAKVYVDNSFNSSFYGWGYDKFNSIQDAIEKVRDEGIVCVSNGVYNEDLGAFDERVYIDKSLNLVGENREKTILIGPTNSSNETCIKIASGIHNVTIQGFTIYGTHQKGVGIYPQAECNNILIHDCVLHSMAEGLSCGESCHSITIRNCTFYNNNGGGGISLRESNYRDIEIYGCECFHNSYGIYIKDAINSVIYHNNLRQNTVDAFDDGKNIWDNGYPYGGNYYEGYVGSDDFWGINQDKIGSDGLIDTPFDIPGDGNKDRYPLMKPWEGIYPIVFPHPDIIYVDDDFNGLTVGWQVTHFDNIENGINAVTEGGTVYVFNGTYYENVNINKTVNLIGEHKKETIVGKNGTSFSFIVKADRCHISNFNLTNGKKGSYNAGMAIYSQYNIIENIVTYAYRNARSGEGFYVSSMFNTIQNCNIKNHHKGIKLTSDNNTISNCNFYNIGLSTIDFRDACYNKVISCNDYNGGGFDVEIHSCYNEIINCTFDNNANGLVFWDFSNNNVVNNCNFSHCKRGVYIYTSKYNHVQDCDFYHCEKGVYNEDIYSIHNSSYNTISNCSFVRCEYGIWLGEKTWKNCMYHNRFNSIIQVHDEGNNFWDNGYPSGGNYWIDYEGIDENGDGIGDTPYIIKGYDIADQIDRYPLMKPKDISVCLPQYVYVDDDFNNSTPGWNYDHFTSIQEGIDAVEKNGTVSVSNGIYNECIIIDKKINLMGEDKLFTIIDGGSGKYIVIICENGCTFKGFSVRCKNESRRCMRIVSNSNRIENNNFSNYNYIGIEMWCSNNNTIVNNIINNNEHGGIYLKYCHNNIIENNILNNHMPNTGIGFQGSTNNIARNNIISRNRDGIDLSDSSWDNIIVGNTITDNSDYGIYSLRNNTIYHNNLINNSDNAYGNPNANIWYSITLLEGNYWSDYGGTDSDGDGIGDTPYNNIIGDINKDLYPLMKPFSTVQPHKGDSNNDGRIDIFDLDAFVQSWGATKNPGGHYKECFDFNDDGKIDIFDFDQFVQEWGKKY